MASEPIIAWDAPAHIHTEKKTDWFWAVGIITLAIAAVAFMLGLIIPGIFVIAAAIALVLHNSKPPHIVRYEISDRGIAADDTLYPFLSLDAFWVPHNEFPPRLLVKSRKLFMPLIEIIIDDVDPEEVRQVMLRYLSETELHEPFLKRFIEWLGF